MNDFEKIEHLLLSKKFEELNPSEMKEVQEYFENATDYNDMRDTLMQVKSTLAADKLLIKPSVDLKEKLLQQFENTYAKVDTKVGRTRPFYTSLTFQWSAAASIVVILTLSAVTYFNNMNGMAKNKDMAVNTDKKTGEQAPPSEEKSLMNTELGTTPTDSISVSGYTTGERKENNTGFNAPVVGSTTDDAEVDKSAVMGNVSKTETTVKETEIQNKNAVNVPDQDESNKPMLKDNTILDTKSMEGEESRDANFHYNDALKGKDDSKLMENNTTIPVKTVNEKNRSTNTKEYWSNKKKEKNQEVKSNEDQKQSIDNVQGGYMSVNQMVQTERKDSLKANLDSTAIDSNNLNRHQRDAKLDIEKDEKEN